MGSKFNPKQHDSNVTLNEQEKFSVLQLQIHKSLKKLFNGKGTVCTSPKHESYLNKDDKLLLR